MSATRFSHGYATAACHLGTHCAELRRRLLPVVDVSHHAKYNIDKGNTCCNLIYFALCTLSVSSTSMKIFPFTGISINASSISKQKMRQNRCLLYYMIPGEVFINIYV